MFAIDLDELEAIHRKAATVSLDIARNAYSFREAGFSSDQKPAHNPTCIEQPTRHHTALAEQIMKSRVLAYLATRGIDLAGGRVMLVTPAGASAICSTRSLFISAPTGIEPPGRRSTQKSPIPSGK